MDVHRAALLAFANERANHTCTLSTRGPHPAGFSFSPPLLKCNRKISACSALLEWTELPIWLGSLGLANQPGSRAAGGNCSGSSLALGERTAGWLQSAAETRQSVATVLMPLFMSPLGGRCSQRPRAGPVHPSSGTLTSSSCRSQIAGGKKKPLALIKGHRAIRETSQLPREECR